MGIAPESRTSPTLLGRLRQQPMDRAAWEQFVDHYGRKIYGWCRRWKLQEADAQDVTQEVLTKLAAKMASFTYDPNGSFRGWLKTVTYRAWKEFLRQRERACPHSGDDEVFALLQNVEAREDLWKKLEEEYDRELLEEAMARVQVRVRPSTWQAFLLHAMDGQPAADVADGLGLSVAAVFMAKSRVQAMIRKEIAGLDAPESNGKASKS